LPPTKFALNFTLKPRYKKKGHQPYLSLLSSHKKHKPLFVGGNDRCPHTRFALNFTLKPRYKKKGIILSFPIIITIKNLNLALLGATIVAPYKNSKQTIKPNPPIKIKTIP
jgi:hypothetical protein